MIRRSRRSLVLNPKASRTLPNPPITDPKGLIKQYLYDGSRIYRNLKALTLDSKVVKAMLKVKHKHGP